MESNSLAQRHWQELVAATEIAAAQLKEENVQDTTKVSKVNGNTSMGNLEGKNSFPIEINSTQQAQDDRRVSVIIFESSFLAKPKTKTTACREKKYNDEDLVTKEDLAVQKSSERRRRQVPTKKSVISEIQTTENTSEASRASKKRKAESKSYMSAKEKAEALESATNTGKRRGCNSKITKAQNNVIENSERHKLVADAITSLSDFTSEMPPSHVDEQENKEAKVIKNSFNEDATTKRRKQAADKLEVAPIERPRRSIRPVIPYGSEVAEQKARNKKLIEISQGSGLPLGQIPHVSRAIDKIKTSDDVLKGLHKLIYGRMGSKHDIKNHIRAFSGFKIQTPLDEIVLKEKLEKWKIAGLKGMCYLFGLKSSGDKQKVVDRVYDFLKNPRDMTAPNEENGKGKSGKKKKSTDRVKTIVSRRKTAKDIFNSEQRLVYKEKAENHSKTRAEIDSLLTEAWRSLTENDKKSYVEKAAEVNRREHRQKRQNLSKNKAKQPEMVEDSDLSEEGFEEFVNKIEERKEERPRAYVMNSNLDCSDLTSDNKNNDSNIKEDSVIFSNSCKSEVHAIMKCR